MNNEKILFFWLQAFALYQVSLCHSLLLLVVLEQGKVSRLKQAKPWWLPFLKNTLNNNLVMKARSELIVKLVVDKVELKEQVYKRIQHGVELSVRKITTEQEKQSWWDEFIDWNKYNEELIKQAFDNPENSYVQEYKRKGFSGGIYLGGTVYEEPTLQEKIKSCRNEMEFQVRKLTWFYNNIELLKTDITNKKSNKHQDKIDQLLNLLSKFHKIAQELRERRQNREALLIKDEYDVQDLLNALLYSQFEDIRKEEFSPSNAGANSRLDFVLKSEKIILEVKMSSDRLGAKELGNELLIDIGRYKGYPDCSSLIIFIYDKGDFIRNKRGLIGDLQNQSTDGFRVTVVINPE